MQLRTIKKIFMLPYVNIFVSETKNIVQMKDKIIDALKTTYANLGLSDKAFDGVASMIEKTIEKEEDIAAAIAKPEVFSLVKAIQGESDALRTKNAQISKELESLKKQVDEPKPKPGDDDDDKNAQLLARIEAMESALKAKEDKLKLETRLSAIREKLKEGGSENDNILGLVMKDASLTDDETDDAAVERLKGVYDTTYKQFYGDGAVPPTGNKTGNKNEHPDQSLIDALRKSGKLPAEQ